MKHLFIVPIISLLFFACKQKQEKDVPKVAAHQKTQNADDPSLPFDTRLKKFVENKLGISQTEKYTMKVYEEHLNDDNKKDVIITVNRYENAVKKAEQDNRVSKSAEIGFFGHHNYFIYYSSISNTFTDPVSISSTPQRELGISFENISSEKHKDLVVDYAIRNSQFRKFFLLINDKPIYAFHWKKYDGWGTDKVESYCFQYDKGYSSDVKDIIINKGILKNIGPKDDYNTIEPQIDCTDVLIKRFFYNTKDGKYYTPN